MGERRFCRQPAHDQVAGRRCLGHAVCAGPAGVFRAHGDNHTQMRRHDVQPLRAVFANLVHDTAATRADQAVRFDNLFDARQCGREIADGALWRGPGCRFVICLGGQMLFLHLDLSQCDRQILEGQLPLILGQLFRPLPMQGMVQLSNQMLLALSNFLKRCDRFHQGRNHRTLRGRDSGKVNGRCRNHSPRLR